MSTVADITDDTASYVGPESTVAPIRAIIAHALIGEDMIVHKFAGGGTMVIESGEFASKAGISSPEPSITPEWVATNFDLAGLLAYANELFARTSAYFESATAADLDKECKSPIGSTVSAAELINAFGLVHFALHAGEVSALKGIQGGKGLPF